MKLKEVLIKPDYQGISFEMDFKNEFSKLKLLEDGVEPLKNKIYQGNDIFYLTDKNDNYLGHIEYEILKQLPYAIKIRSSFSKQKGFYELMFKIILAKTGIKYLFGDNEQTKRAIKSWKKLLSKYTPVVFNTETNEIESYSENKSKEYYTDNRNSSKKYIVGISSKLFVEMFEEVETLIESRKNRLTDITEDYLFRKLDLELEDVKQIVKYKRKGEPYENTSGQQIH